MVANNHPHNKLYLSPFLQVHHGLAMLLFVAIMEGPRPMERPSKNESALEGLALWPEWDTCHFWSHPLVGANHKAPTNSMGPRVKGSTNPPCACAAGSENTWQRAHLPITLISLSHSPPWSLLYKTPPHPMNCIPVFPKVLFDQNIRVLSTLIPQPFLPARLVLHLCTSDTQPRARVGED